MILADDCRPACERIIRTSWAKGVFAASSVFFAFGCDPADCSNCLGFDVEFSEDSRAADRASPPEAAADGAATDSALLGPVLARNFAISPAAVLCGAELNETAGDPCAAPASAGTVVEVAGSEGASDPGPDLPANRPTKLSPLSPIPAVAEDAEVVCSFRPVRKSLADPGPVDP